jgi:hypothetical protein
MANASEAPTDSDQRIAIGELAGGSKPPLKQISFLAVKVPGICQAEF